MATELRLTFDDGPSTYTPALLDVLQEFEVRATFFMLGEHVDQYPNTAKLVYKRGHRVGNHTQTHPKLTRLSRRDIQREIYGCSKALKRVGIDAPNLFRPPYGETNELVAGAVRAHGMLEQLWDIDPQDWDPGISAEEIVFRLHTQCEQCTEARPVILLHDGGGDRSETVRAVEMFLGDLRMDGRL